MHGRPRLPPGQEPDPAKIAQYREKAAQFQVAVTMVCAAKAARNYDDKVLKVSAGVLLKNPDVSTLWNYRREAFAPLFATGGEAATALAAAELALTEKCLIEQPKSYSTWHHRRWVVEKGFTDLTAELQLVNKLLRADTRNFHGWNYRFFLTRLMGRSDEDELEYTHQLVTSDFSNFSAWHYRSLLLPRVHAARGHHTLEQLLQFPDLGTATQAAQSSTSVEPGCVQAAGDGDRVDYGVSAAATSGSGGAGGAVREAARGAAVAGHMEQRQGGEGEGEKAGGGGPGGSLEGPAVSAVPPLPLYELATEFELLKTALCMDPGDASAWSYHRWLLDGVAENVRRAGEGQAAAEARSAARAQLEKEAELCQELVELVEEESGGALRAGDPTAKWPLLTLAGIKRLQSQLTEMGPEDRAALQNQEAELYKQLQGLDPLRKGFYIDQAAGISSS